MNGRELLNSYQSKRDFSGSKDDEYAQLLETLHYHLSEDVLFNLLEKAELGAKRLNVIEDHEILSDTILLKDIVLV